MVEDACTGQHAIKRRGEEYLPRPNPSDFSLEANQRYAQYLSRAVYYNATGRTLSSLVGMAFGKWPEIAIPAALEYLTDDADGAGCSLVQSCQMALAELLKTGRAGLLVDFPVVENTAETSVYDVKSGNTVATINLYPAHSIINWQTERVGGSQILTLVVIREVVNQYSEFGFDTQITYRVLRLRGGMYVQEVWTKDEGAEDYTLDTTSVPLNGKGQPWSEIPFAFLGAVRNTPELESFASSLGTSNDLMVSPLYDIAALNIAHYRNSADYEDSVFLTGQPQGWMSGLDPEWRDTLVKNGVMLGSRYVLPLPVGGSFGIAQASPNNLVRQAMLDKEEQMRALGAKLIQPNTGRSKTATQASTDAANDASVLALVCDNISLGYTDALGWAAEFMGAEGECSLAIDTEFAVNPLDAPSIMAAVQAWQAGAVPQTDLWAYLRKVSVIDPEKTDDEIRAEIEAEQPQGGMSAILGGAPKGAANPNNLPGADALTQAANQGGQ